MSKTIDERVVEMRFDNKHFESNVKTTMSTLDRLKQSLNLKGATKGLENISDASKRVNMTSLGNSVDAVKVRFSALQVMGVTALANITNSAVNAGKRMVSALTIDPVKTGFNEYETKINSIQTIMSNTASKGTTMADVTKVIDELNVYADKTIYNFAEMTRNIGTFTAAGVGLKESASAIQGIANLAAASGSNSQQASTAMYQLSQALAAGTVKLQDWNSVVNAGMGGEKFQEALKTTAREHGIAVDKMIEKEGSFRESLKGGWITADVLNETLNKFTVDGAKKYAQSMIDAGKWTQKQADALIKEAQAMEDAATKVKTFTQLWDTLKESAQSGWSQTWEIVIGDFEEAKKLFTKLSDKFGGMINNMSDARNKLLKGAMGSKWDKFTNQIKDAGIASEDFKEALIETAKTHGVVTDEMIAEEGFFEKALKDGIFTKDMVIETMRKFADGMLGAKNATGSMKTKLEEFQNVVNRVINGDFGNGAARVKALTNAGYKYATVQGMVNKVIAGGKIEMSDLSDSQSKNNVYTKEQISKLGDLAKQAKETGTPINELIEDMSKPSGRGLLIDSFYKVVEALEKPLNAIKDAWVKIFPPMTEDQLYNIIEGLNEFTESLIMSDDEVNNFKKVCEGLLAIFDLTFMGISRSLTTGLKILKAVLELFNTDILSVAASVADVIVKFRDWIKTNTLFLGMTNKVASFIKTVIVTTHEWMSELLNLPEVENAISKFQNGFKNFVSNFESYLTGGEEAFKNFSEKVKSINKLSFDNVIQIVKDFNDTVVKKMFNVEGAVNKLKNGLTNFKEKTKENFESIKQDFNFFIEFIKSKLPGISLGNILTIIFGTGLIASLKGLTNVLDRLVSPMEALMSIPKGIGKVLSGVQEALKGYSMKLKADALFKIALAIAVLAGSIAILAQLDYGKVWSSVGAITVLAGVLIGLTYVLGKIDVAGKISISMVAVASTLLMFALTLKKLENLDVNKILDNLKTLSVLIAELIIVMYVINKLPASPTTGITTIVGFAASLWIMVSALEKINNIDLKDDAFKNLTGIMVLLIGLMASTKLLGPQAKVAGKNMLGVSVALLLMVKTFKMLNDIDVTSKTVGKLILAIGSLISLMAATKLLGPQAASAGKSMIGVSLALYIMGKSFDTINKMTVNSKTIKNLIVVVGSLAGLMAATNLAGVNAAKAGASTLLMAASIGLLAGVLVVLSKLDPEGTDRALIIITKLSVIFAGLIYATKFATDCNKTLIALSIAIGTLAVSLGLLSMIDQNNLKNASRSLSMVIGSFAILVKSTQVAKPAVGALATMMVVVAGLASILAIMSNLTDADSCIKTSSSISLLLLSLSASMAIIGKTGPILSSSIGKLALMGLVVAELGVILGLMGALNVQPSIETAGSLSILLLAMSGALAILSFVGKSGVAAYNGIGALATLIAAMGVIIGGIGALMEECEAFEDAEKWLDKGLVVIEKIGYGLGSFVGNIFKGIAVSAISGLKEIADNLSLFMDGIQPFLNSVKEIDSSSVEGVKSLAETIYILSNSKVIDNETITAFGNQIVEFGKAMIDYSDTVKGKIDSEAIRSSADAAKYLVELANNIPNSGGLAGLIMGDNEISTFGNKVQVFGLALVAYSRTITANGGIDAKAIKNSAEAAKGLVELANNIPNSGGFLGFLAGDNDISTFGNKLQTFGYALVAYSRGITANGGIDNAAIANSVEAAKLLVELANTIPNEGGLLSKFTGDNDFETFGKNLKSFGSSLVDFKNNTSDVADTKFISVVNQFSRLVYLAKDIQNVDTSKMSSFGKSLKSLADSGIDAFIKAFEDANSRLEKTVTEFVNKTSDVLLTKKTNVTNNFYDVGSNIADGTVRGINENTFKVEAQAAAMARKALKAAKEELGIHSPSKAFEEEVGAMIGPGVARGIKKGSNDAVDESSQIAKDIIEASKKPLEQFENWLEGKKFYNELSTSEELFAWEQAQARYKKGTEERTKADKQVYSLRNQLEKENLDNFKSWLDDRAYYNNLTTEEELYAWEQIQNRYLEGTEERKEADRKVFELRNKLREEDYQKSLDWIDKQNKLTSKLAGAKRVQLRQDIDSDEYKEMSEDAEGYMRDLEDATNDYFNGRDEIMSNYEAELKNLEKEYLSQCEEVNEQLKQDIQDLNDAYDEALESRTKTLYDSYGLFDWVDSAEKMDGSDLIENLQSQVNAFDDWQSDINELASKGIDKKLIEELQEMGPSSATQIKALNNMSASELDRYVSLWEEKCSLASNQAKTELKGMRSDTNKQIATLRVEAAAELDKLEQTWNDSQEELRVRTNQQLEELRDDYLREIGILSDRVNHKFTIMVTKAANIIGDKTKWSESGANIIAGMVEGIANNAVEVYDTVQDVVSNMISVANSTAGIASPAKEFIKIGKYSDEGLIVGLKDLAGKVGSTAASVGKNAINSLKKQISKIPDIINGDVDYQPTIRPVLDLSEIQNGISLLNSLFNQPAFSLDCINDLNTDRLDIVADLMQKLDGANSDVVDAITDLRGDFANLIEAIGNMHISIDGDAMVGRLINKIDSGLGQIATHKGRGN